jgi:hypothetical protein
LTVSTPPFVESRSMNNLLSTGVELPPSSLSFVPEVVEVSVLNLALVAALLTSEDQLPIEVTLSRLAPGF